MSELIRQTRFIVPLHILVLDVLFVFLEPRLADKVHWFAGFWVSFHLVFAPEKDKLLALLDEIFKRYSLLLLAFSF